MSKEGQTVLVPLSEEHRQMMREARERLGLTQATLEKAARLGKTYVSYVESGRTKSTDPAQLIRLLKALHTRAERAQAPARIKAGLLRALKAVEGQGQGKTKQ